MLREEVREVEEASASGIVRDVLAELVDVLYLTLNLGQECGLEQWLEPAFLMKHGDNMRMWADPWRLRFQRRGRLEEVRGA